MFVNGHPCSTKVALGGPRVENLTERDGVEVACVKSRDLLGAKTRLKLKDHRYETVVFSYLISAVADQRIGA